MPLRIAALVLIGIVAPALHGAVLSGVVRFRTGDALQRSVVWAVTENCHESYRTVADEAGRYSFEAMPSGQYKVYAEHPGFVQVSLESVALTSGDAKVDLVLVNSEVDTGGSPPVGPVQGVITDSTGRPVEGARVIYESGRETALTDAAGKFGICRSGERLDLRIEHAEYRKRTVKVKMDFEKQPMRQLKIVLRKR